MFFILIDFYALNRLNRAKQGFMTKEFVMELITPVSPERDYSNKKIVFLAGPIKGAPDWQAQAIKDLADLDVYVANPRRENVVNFNLDLQVNWESRFLAADGIVQRGIGSRVK